jgi:exonuclease VII small subunit
LENTINGNLRESLEFVDLDLQSDKRTNLDLMACLQHLKKIVLNDGVTTLQDVCKLFTNVFSMYEESEKKLKEANKKLQEICEDYHICQKELVLRNSSLYEAQKRMYILQKILRRKRFFFRNCLSSDHSCCKKYTKLDKQVSKHSRKKKGFDHIEWFYRHKNCASKNNIKNSKKIFIKTKPVSLLMESNQSYMNHKHNTLGCPQNRIFLVPKHSALYNSSQVLRECRRYQRYPSIAPSVIFLRKCQRKGFLSSQQLYSFFNHCNVSYKKSSYCFFIIPVKIGVHQYNKNIFSNPRNIFRFYFRKTHFNQWRQSTEYLHLVNVPQTILKKTKRRKCKTVTNYLLNSGRSNPIFAEKKHSIISHFLNKTITGKLYVRYSIIVYTLLYFISTSLQGANPRDLKRHSLQRSFLYSTLHPLKHLCQSLSLFLYHTFFLIKKSFSYTIFFSESGYEKDCCINRSKAVRSCFCTRKSKGRYTQRNHTRKAFDGASFFPCLVRQLRCKPLVKFFIKKNRQWNRYVQNIKTTVSSKDLHQKHFLVHCGAIGDVNVEGFLTVNELRRNFSGTKRFIFFVSRQKMRRGILMLLYCPFTSNKIGVCHKLSQVPTAKTFSTSPSKRPMFPLRYLHVISLIYKNFLNNQSTDVYDQLFQNCISEITRKFGAFHTPRSLPPKIEIGKVPFHSNLQEFSSNSQCSETNIVATLNISDVHNGSTASKNQYVPSSFLCRPVQNLTKCLRKHETVPDGLDEKLTLVSLSLSDDSTHVTLPVEDMDIKLPLLCISNNNTIIRFSKLKAFQMLTPMVCGNTAIQQKSCFQLPQVKLECQFIQSWVQLSSLRSYKDSSFYCVFLPIFNMYLNKCSDNCVPFSSELLLRMFLNFLCDFESTFFYISPNVCHFSLNTKDFFSRLDKLESQHQVSTLLFLEKLFADVNLHVPLNFLLALIQCEKLELNSRASQIFLPNVKNLYNPRETIVTSIKYNSRWFFNNLLLYVLSSFSNITLMVHIPRSEPCYISQLPSTSPFVKRVYLDGQQTILIFFDMVEDFSIIFHYKKFMKLLSEEKKIMVFIKFFQRKPYLRNIIHFFFNTIYNFPSCCLHFPLTTRWF